ncbi:RNA-directed DNA polymerase, eukaryota, reverse transcriptase zinc-binding domain protein [Tanacetum coccineum]
MTKERWLKKSGKLDFARVLVEINAEEDLPHFLEISYPPFGNRPARIGKLEVKYQWNPPLCTHCKSFGHCITACKVRPMTQNEIAVINVNRSINVGNSVEDIEDDGFVRVGKKNRPLNVQSVSNKRSEVNRNSGDQGVHNKGFQNNVRRNFVVSRHNYVGQQSKKNVKFVLKDTPVKKNSGLQSKNGSSIVQKPMKEKESNIEAAMEEEYNNVVWPKMQDVMETGFYPFIEHGLDPSFEDDDVTTKDGAMADEMRPECDDDMVSQNIENDLANVENLVNDA